MRYVFGIAIDNAITAMDREIPEQIKKARRRKNIIRLAIVAGGLIAAIVLIDVWLNKAISTKSLSIGLADRGTIEITVNAGGKLAPLTEQIVTSPIGSRILEVYKSPGEHVEYGEPLLKLDMSSVESEYLRMVDERAMRRSKLVQVRLDLENSLYELETRGQIQSMKLDQLHTDLLGERYLDSLGASTPDKVRRAELNYDEAKLLLAQTAQRIVNERQRVEAGLRVQELELAIFEKSLQQSARLLEDARILSPQSATLTFIDNRIGSPVSQGTQLAVVSDLSRFKVEAEIADGYADRIRAGARATIEVGSASLSGTVTNVVPTTSNGLVSFIVVPDESDHPGLRSGLRVEVYVQYGIEDNAVRLPYSSAFSNGPGVYDVWIVDGNRATRRKIAVGGMSRRYVTVAQGLEPGERVILSNMDAFKNRTEIKLK